MAPFVHPTPSLCPALVRALPKQRACKGELVQMVMKAAEYKIHRADWRVGTPGETGWGPRRASAAGQLESHVLLAARATWHHLQQSVSLGKCWSFCSIQTST